jgi:hypothetical protein
MRTGKYADASWSLFAVRPAAFLVWLLVVGCCCGPMSFAQERNYAPREPGAMSPLRKLDLFQQSVKRKLKSALGVKDKNETAPDDEQTISNHAMQHREMQNREIAYENSRPDERDDQPYDTRTTSRHGYNIAEEQAAEHGRVVVAADRFAQDQYVPENAMRPVEYREQYQPAPYGYYDSGRPLPPPVAEIATGEIPQPDPRFAASDGNNNRVPVARGSVLGDSQITATQHALRLIEENGDLKAKLAMIDAENKRMREKLAQTETLLGRSTQAVEAAYKEIETMRTINRELQTKLSESEQKYNRYLMESDRMLQSIREELDNVLVREITAKGN